MDERGNLGKYCVFGMQEFYRSCVGISQDSIHFYRKTQETGKKSRNPNRSRIIFLKFLQYYIVSRGGSKGGLGGLQPPYKLDLSIKLVIISVKFLLISSFNSKSSLFSLPFVHPEPRVR
jgi:hypothetical protein